MDNYIAEHKKIYDALAKDYENRVDALASVTQHAVDLMARYLKPNASILEVGCGAGLAAKLFTEKGFAVTCIELSSKMIFFARRRNPNVKFIRGDFMKARLKRAFDGVFGFAFIHLFPKKDAELVLKKIHKILRPGGIIYIGTTKSKTSLEGWQIKKDYGEKYKRFRKHWTEAEFRNAIRAAGFKIIDSLVQKDPFGKEWIDIVGKK